ncbi:MAG: ISAzo13 family transposase [Clostridia bacterium]|nr:ISAzo13 family transposase [Clostridia bacterium]
MMPYLNESQRRKLAALSAKAIGYGGIVAVKNVAGMSRSTITSGIEELGLEAEDTQENSESSEEESNQDEQDETVSSTPSGAPPGGSKIKTRVRREGAGRKSAKTKIPKLYNEIEKIVNKKTYGDPTRVLVWTTLSLRKIAEELSKDPLNIKVSQNIISRALDELGYSKQKNQKNLQIGEATPDRDAQFQFINDTADKFIAAGEPVISIDTKKKENIGNFINKGEEYRKSKDPRQVLDHDFAIPELGRVIPYGVYLLNNNTGFINLGTDHDTSEFAAESIFRWWECVGRNTFPNAKRLYITADSGGSNGVRVKMWKYVLQTLANQTGLEIHVSHFPSGTSKWNKIEHRLFCYISKNWQGQPLIDIETVVNLISSTTTKKGLKVICKVDENKYELKKQVSDEEMASINLERLETFGYWNYIIRPNNIAEESAQDN